MYSCYHGDFELPLVDFWMRMVSSIGKFFTSKYLFRFFYIVSKISNYLLSISRELVVQLITETNVW